MEEPPALQDRKPSASRGEMVPYSGRSSSITRASPTPYPGGVPGVYPGAYPGAPTVPRGYGAMYPGRVAQQLDAADGVIDGKVHVPFVCAAFVDVNIGGGTPMFRLLFAASQWCPSDDGDPFFFFRSALMLGLSFASISIVAPRFYFHVLLMCFVFLEAQVPALLP